MYWPAYIPSSATLVILFKIARARLMASSRYVTLLSDARLISATEEMNKLSDDLRDAARHVVGSRGEPAQPGKTRWASDAELPIADLAVLAKVAAWAALRQAVNTGTEPARPHH
jgi:hypothetical protein